MVCLFDLVRACVGFEIENGIIILACVRLYHLVDVESVIEQIVGLSMLLE